MSRRERRKVLVGPWRNVHAAVWLIGLAILAWRGWWWPGILVLVAISTVLEAVLTQVVPDAAEETAYAGAVTGESPAPQAPVPTPEHRLELLPSTCPQCGAPVRGADVKWTGPQSADCAYCGVNLPMKTK